MINSMKVLIVILNYNGIHLLKKHLSSVVKTDYPNFDICVVDNGSTDDSVEYLKKEYPNIKIVKSNTNLGFGKGNNLGVSSNPGYDAYVLVNNDVSVERNWLSELVEVAESSKDIGAVGPKILYSKKKDGRYIINSAGMTVDSHYMAYDRYEGEIDSKKYNVTEEVSCLTGGVLLIKKEVWEKVVGFNPKMFLYYEDVDFCLRIKDAGYKLYYCGSSVVYHDHMASTGGMGSFKRNIMSTKNRYISIVSRLGFLIGLTETLWYIFNWIVWKLIYSKRFTLKEFLEKKNE